MEELVLLGVWAVLVLILATFALACSGKRAQDRQDPDNHQVTALYVYPVKGCRGQKVAEVQVTRLGFAHDRAFAVVDAATGAVLAAGDEPGLLAIEPTCSRTGDLTLSKPGSKPLVVQKADLKPTKRLELDGAGGEALDAGDAAAAWLQAALVTKRKLRLVRIKEEAGRMASKIDGAKGGQLARSGDDVRWHELAPLTVVCQASVDDLNKRLAKQGKGQVAAEDFRPNVLVTSQRPYVEDAWETVKLVIARGWHAGKFVPLRAVCTTPLRKDCAPDSASAHACLKQYRTKSPGALDGDAWFGSSLFLATSRASEGAVVSVGDELEVEHWRKAPKF